MPAMIFVHEVHKVHGPRSRAFEAAFRDEWAPVLAKSDARLLWFFHQAHGSGPSYVVVTITAFTGAAAWEDFAFRVQRGDLNPLARHLDEFRHDVTGKVLLPLPWSPLQEVDFAEVDAADAQHPASLFMEDTGWPYEGRLDDYVAALGEDYRPMVANSSIIDLQAAFQPAYGTHRRREAILLQRIPEHQALLGLLTHEEPESYPEDSWMTKALTIRDQWESRLLRTAPWSPRW